MRRFFLPVAAALAATSAAAGEVAVLPMPGPWVKGPVAVVTGEPRSHGLDGVTMLPEAGYTATGAATAARRDAATVVASLNARDRARLAARIEAELASRTR